MAKNKSSSEKGRYRSWIAQKFSRFSEKAPETSPEETPVAVSQEEAALSENPISLENPFETLPASEDFLHILWESWKQHTGAYSPLGSASLQPAAEGFPDYREEAVSFLREQQIYAEALLPRTSDSAASPADAQVRVLVSGDLLRAWVFIFPPSAGGRDVTEEQLQDALRSHKVVYGFCKESLRDAVEHRRYMQLTDAAAGSPAIHGKDGQLMECLDRYSSVARREGEDDLAEFENRIVFHVSVGTVLYRATPPTEGRDGIDVQGTRMKGRMGKAPSFPKIPNTVLSEDRTELRSTVDGMVSFMNEQFVLEELLIVDGNVDTASGDVEFEGDVQVNGDVCEGRSVTATGSIIVHGMVEVGHLKAGRNITLVKGMNGNQEGTVSAGMDLTSKYLENCTVEAGGLIQTNSIVCCDVVCGDEIRVNGTRGFIIGGSCTALHKITAAGVGAKSQRPTLIVLGTTPGLLTRCMQIESELETVSEELEAVEKNLRYLQGLRPAQFTAERRQLLSQYRLQKPVLSLRVQKLESEHKELEKKIGNVSACRLVCNVLYPATKISIGNASLSVEKEHRFCHVYYAKSTDSIVISNV